MATSGYPLSCIAHDVCNHIFRKRRLLESYGYYKTMSGEYHDGHGNFIDARKMTYKELKNKLNRKL